MQNWKSPWFTKFSFELALNDHMVFLSKCIYNCSPSIVCIPWLLNTTIFLQPSPQRTHIFLISIHVHNWTSRYVTHSALSVYIKCKIIELRNKYFCVYLKLSTLYWGNLMLYLLVNLFIVQNQGFQSPSVMYSCYVSVERQNVHLDVYEGQ